MPITIPLENPSSSVIDLLNDSKSFLSEVTRRSSESLWRRLVGDEILAMSGLTGRGLLLNRTESALWLALRLSRIDRGDKVLFPMNGVAHQAKVVERLGADLLFLDVESETLAISPSGVEEVLEACLFDSSPYPKSVVYQHYGGVKKVPTWLYGLADEYHMSVIEIETDAYIALQRESLFPSYRIVPIGEYADGIAGSGVILICPTEERCQRAKSLLRGDFRDLGIAEAIGMGGVEASSMQLLRGYAERLNAEKLQAYRKSLYESYQQKLASVDGLRIWGASEGTTNNYLRLPLFVDESLLHFSKDELRLYLYEAGIETKVLEKVLCPEPYFPGAGVYLTGIADAWQMRGLSLPMGSGLHRDDVEQICKEIYKIVSHFSSF